MIPSAKKLLVNGYQLPNDTFINRNKIGNFVEDVLSATITPGASPLMIIGSKASASEAAQIRVYNPTTGALIQRFAYRAAQTATGTAAAPGGLAFDGTNLISFDTVLDNIHRHSGISDTYLTSFQAQGTTSAVRGLAYSGGDCTTFSQGVLTTYVGFTPTVRRQVSLVDQVVILQNFCSDGTNIIATDGGSRVFVINPRSGATLKTLDFLNRIEGGAGIGAVAFNGRNVVLFSTKGNFVYTLGKGL